MSQSSSWLRISRQLAQRRLKNSYWFSGSVAEYPWWTNWVLISKAKMLIFNMTWKRSNSTCRKRPRCWIKNLCANIAIWNTRGKPICWNILLFMVNQWAGRDYLSHKYNVENHFTPLGSDGRLVHKCDCCLIYFATKDELNAHKRKMHQVKLTCKICNRYFDCSDKLHTHIRKVHTSVVRNRHMCIKCGQLPWFYAATAARLPS